MKKFSDTAFFFLLSRTALLLLAAVTGGTAYCELSMLSRARVQQFDIFVQSEEKTMVPDLKHNFKIYICLLSVCLHDCSVYCLSLAFPGLHSFKKKDETV